MNLIRQPAGEAAVTDAERQVENPQDGERAGSGRHTTGFGAAACAAAAILVGLAMRPALAQETGGADADGNASGGASEIEEIVVRGNIVGGLGLYGESDSGSRLGLSVMETPASVDIIDSVLMEARGYRKVTDALADLAGVVAGEHPSTPSTFSMRGFVKSQITVLRDGLWLGPSTMTMRHQNTFNLERVEVLRGPSSVLNGNGAVAGSVNTITKTAFATDQTSVNGLASYGRHDTFHLGLGAGGPLGESVYYRADVSQYSSDGFIDRADSKSTNFTGSVLWEVTDDFSLKGSVDYLDDENPTYQGTPLVPESVARDPMRGVIRTNTDEVIDRATRFENYNTGDAYVKADQLFTRLDMAWNVTDNVEINNTIFSYRADRHWKNAEGFVYCREEFDGIFPCAGPEHQGQVQRYFGYFILDHEQEQFGNRFTVNFERPLGDMESKWVLGYELNDIDFVRTRGFRLSEPLVDADSVDLYDPEPGVYGNVEWRGRSPANVENKAFFGEGMLEVLPSLSVVFAARFEQLDLERADIGLVPGPDFETVEDQFDRQFDFWSYRVGAVYDLTENTVAYAQYSNAKDPVGSNIFVVRSDQDYDLVDARSWEIGWKAVLLDRRLETTLAYYDIKRDDVTAVIGRDAVGLVGGRTAKGVELAATLRPVDRLDVGVTASYTDAQIDPSPNADIIAGNRPLNIPKWTASAFVSYDRIAGLPLNVGASARYIGDRYADHANTVEMLDYTLVNFFVGWDLTDNLRLSARIENAFDEEYSPWSSPFYLQQTDPGFLYANQMLLGAPRSYGLSLEFDL